MQDLFNMNADKNCSNEAVNIIHEMISQSSPSTDAADDSNSFMEKELENMPDYQGSSPACLEFLQKVKTVGDAEAQIRFSMNFMKESLSCSNTPRFRDFWDVRRFCLPLFKQSIGVKVRAELWREYVDLSTEARRIKEMLDEQSAFAFEQIDLAIQSLVKDIESSDELLLAIPDLVIPEICLTMLHHKVEYQQTQRELNLLNTFALKINSLRKEVIRTEMRIKNKNKLFEKLSSSGDRIFPKRKVLIKKVSDMFMADVQAFINRYFGNPSAERVPLHQLREEIKALQTVAKSFTLNVNTFTDTRVKLSQCWDQLKSWDKERKKEFFQKKQDLQQNVDQVMERIKGFELLAAQASSFAEVAPQFEEVLSFMRGIELSFYDQKKLKETLFKLRKPFLDKEEEIRAFEQLQEKQNQELKRKQVADFKESLEALAASLDSTDIETLIESRERILQESAQIQWQKSDKMMIDRLLKQIKDGIEEKKSYRLLSLSDSDKEKHQALLTLLIERKQRRAEMKLQIDGYRKVLAGSGFDFEKAIMYKDLIEAERLSLEKVNESIYEIEKKLVEIQG